MLHPLVHRTSSRSRVLSSARILCVTFVFSIACIPIFLWQIIEILHKEKVSPTLPNDGTLPRTTRRHQQPQHPLQKEVGTLNLVTNQQLLGRNTAAQGSLKGEDKYGHAVSESTGILESRAGRLSARQMEQRALQDAARKQKNALWDLESSPQTKEVTPPHKEANGRQEDSREGVEKGARSKAVPTVPWRLWSRLRTQAFSMTRIATGAVRGAHHEGWRDPETANTESSRDLEQYLQTFEESLKAADGTNDGAENGGAHRNE
ncbi:hypothetical protein CYMTET_10195, partial [Cymbomonas tetramitiformis]